MAEARHVLVVEDEALAALAIEDYLIDCGFRVSVAGDGIAALERFDRDPADLVVTDLRMPRMDGRSLIRELRRRRPTLPIVVMTGFVAFLPGEDDLTGADWMPLEVLRKPVSPTEMLAAMERVARG
ncbi:response regulator [Azospirillum sp. RWY-5-1]|uniref:Response regulator n=1 Tax=Azospirillum oleiclasticum TaxID=2735135 RepID=A0ABX2T4S7_9PROT|nr:response regulator [Azospirillum oleiclasticum]NYZ12177.1 response regulator [Azospirillum oleiclasticum]NYZ19337.1 response regulator [Azospirillum oleiclasticum]